METNTLLHLKHKIESLLFSAARKLSIAEMMRLTRAKEEDILRCLKEYKKELEEKGGSLQLEQDGEYWQLNVKEQYIPVIKKVVTQTEMPKTIIETLAVVAYKAPVLQSGIIKIRTNKAYKHIDWLEEKGFITREKKGRTKLIRLTPKFYDYFNLDPRQVKEAFKTISSAEETEKKKVEIYTAEPEEKVKFSEGVEPYTETLGKLEIYKEKKEHKKKHKEKHKTKEEEEKTETEEKKEEPERLKITPEQEKKAEERVKEIIGLKEEQTEKEEEKNE